MEKQNGKETETDFRLRVRTFKNFALFKDWVVTQSPTTQKEFAKVYSALRQALKAEEHCI